MEKKLGLIVFSFIISYRSNNCLLEKKFGSVLMNLLSEDISNFQNFFEETNLFRNQFLTYIQRRLNTISIRS